MSVGTQPRFLTAEWRHLVMLNYEIDASRLAPLVPPPCELDLWGGRSFVSVVGFQFLDTRVRGVPVPFHRNFLEVNLRFYVRCKFDGEWRRGVVFVKELVPRRAIAWVANLTYGEYYAASSTQQLKRVYEHLSARMVIERSRTVEITALLIAIGAMLLVISAFCSLLWFKRLL